MIFKIIINALHNHYRESIDFIKQNEAPHRKHQESHLVIASIVRVILGAEPIKFITFCCPLMAQIRGKQAQTGFAPISLLAA